MSAKNGSVITLVPGDYRTSIERKPAKITNAGGPACVVKAAEEARTIPASEVAGYSVLPADPATSGAPHVPVDRPDLDGHVIRNGVCINEGCGFRLAPVMSEPMTDEDRAKALAEIRARRRGEIAARYPAEELVQRDVTASNRLAGIEARCPGEKRPAFTPRVVKWCPTCTLPIGDGCICPQ